MKIFADSKYIVFPVNTSLPSKVLNFYDSGKLVYALDMKICKENPNFYAYVDVTPFKGAELELTYPDTEEIPFRKADVMDIPGLYTEALRPKIHFTTKSGWINDPNGLVYYDGLYHLYFQYNPTDPEWNNMHWGHAVSRDLIHWEELSVELYPDMLGQMFSGGAFVDKKNASGLAVGGKEAVLLYYTACGYMGISRDNTLKCTQCLAVSTDGLKTVKKYEGNPIVPAIAPQNRDPKVVYSEELDCYLMALYTEEHKKGDYSIFKSSDLLKWERFFDYELEGEWEFPDIMKFKTSDGGQKYVFTSNTDCFVVYEIRDGKFRLIQKPQKVWFADDNHSPLSFDNIPDGRCIRAIWERYKTPVMQGTNGFSGQIIALEYTLEECCGKYYFAAHPLKELSCLYEGERTEKNVALTGDGFRFDLEPRPYLIRLKTEECDDVITLTFFGHTLTFNLRENLISYLGDEGKTCPVNLAGSGLDVQILIDECGFEIFSDGGKSCMYSVDGKSYIDREKAFGVVSSESGRATLSSLDIISLRSIWEDVK